MKKSAMMVLVLAAASLLTAVVAHGEMCCVCNTPPQCVTAKDAEACIAACGSASNVWALHLGMTCESGCGRSWDAAKKAAKKPAVK